MKALIEDRRWDDNPNPPRHGWKLGVSNKSRIVFIGDDNEIFKWILRHTPFSNTEALTRQGYSIEELPDGAKIGDELLPAEK